MGVYQFGGNQHGIAPAGTESMSIPTALTGVQVINLRRATKEVRAAFSRVEAGTTTIRDEMAELDRIEAVADSTVGEHSGLPSWLG